MASNWRASVAPGGSPGASDAVPFVGDPDLDGDFDGLTAFMEHAMGSSDASPNSGATISFEGSGRLVFEYPRNLAADDVIYEVQVSPNLVDWTPVAGGFEFSDETVLGDGTSLVAWRTIAPIAAPREFVRLEVRSR